MRVCFRVNSGGGAGGVGFDSGAGAGAQDVQRKTRAFRSISVFCNASTSWSYVKEERWFQLSPQTSDCKLFLQWQRGREADI